MYLDTSVDGYVLAFALGLSCACALVFGFVPALKTSRVDLITLMNDISPRMASRGMMRSVLVVSQVAVSLVLLIGAGLVLRSYSAARHADGGFDSPNVTALAIDLQTSGYDEARGLELVNRLLDAAQTEPAFESATLASNVPLSLVDNASRAVTIEGYAPRADEDLLVPLQRRGTGLFPHAEDFPAGRPRLHAHRRHERNAGGDCERNTGAAHLADAGERDRQTLEDRHRRLALHRSAWCAT